MENFHIGNIFILIYMLLAIGFIFFILISELTIKFKYKYKVEKLKNLTNIDIFLEDGTLIKSYQNVYLHKIDKNTYKIYDENKLFVELIDKGNRMLLIAKKDNN